MAQLQQLHFTKVAYERLLEEEPVLPPPGSLLPALLALRDSKSLVQETKDAVAVTNKKLSTAQAQLAAEEADLQDARAMQDALQARISKARVDLQAKSEQSPDEIAQELLKRQQIRQLAADKETKKLVKALTKFINAELAGMLAAEELGGPVVGDLVGVSDDTLEAGFNHLGKTKRIKADGDNEDRKQRRIDQIWGSHARGDDGQAIKSERQVAAREMRSLVEELLNLAVEQGTGSYVTLQRESAAARFLVRAKAAQFHPKDAKRLRLIDFGRELDD